MQHHNIPTRLLDWTMNSLVALFFACQEYVDINTKQRMNGKVFIFNPWIYWKRIVENITHPLIHDIHIYVRSLLSISYIHDNNIDLNFIQYQVKRKFNWDLNMNDINIDCPFAFVASFSNPRLLAQKGCFTIHGIKKNCLESFLEKEEYEKIEIDNNSKSSILKELSLLGIDAYSLFPDFEGMSKKIHNSNSLFNI